jgi:hypothetical protein
MVNISPSPDAPARRLTRCVGLRLEPELYDRVELAAEQDGRSVSGYVRRVLLEKLEKEK